MANATHTPGPWRVLPGSAGSWEIMAFPPGDPEGTLVAVTFITGKELANARLIAAAPGLLAALRDAAEFLDSCAEYAQSVTAAGLYHEARKAIAKATGQ